MADPTQPTDPTDLEWHPSDFYSFELGDRPERLDLSFNDFGTLAVAYLANVDGAEGFLEWLDEMTHEQAHKIASM